MVIGALRFVTQRYILWQDTGSGASQLWQLGPEGTTIANTVALNGGNSWRLVGMADFNADGFQDLVWEDPVSGSSQIWLMGGSQGTEVMSSAVLSGPNSWRIVALADFNGDGYPDIVWQDPATGASQIWYMGGAQGTSFIGSLILGGPNAWRIATVADFNADGYPDLVWQDPDSGASQIWFMGGPQGATIVN